MPKKRPKEKEIPIFQPVDGDAFSKALAPVTLPFTDDELGDAVNAENARRAETTAQLEKSMNGVTLDEVGDYTLATLRALSGGKKAKANRRIENAMEEAARRAAAVDVQAAEATEQALRGKSAEKFNDWAGKGAPTAKPVTPMKRITLKPSQP